MAAPARLDQSCVVTETTPTQTTPSAPEPRPAETGDETRIDQAESTDPTVRIDQAAPAAQTDPVDETSTQPVVTAAPPPPPAAPSAPAGLRVSDADREAVAQALREAGLEGRLSPDELATRESAAYAAVTAPDLYALVSDLPVARELAASQLAPYGLRSEPVPTPTAGSPVPAGSGVGPPTTLWSVLGEVKRSGKWDVPERLSVHLALAETRLDLREATLTAPVTTIDILGTLGEVKVIVPDSWRIECSGSGVLGTYQVKDVDAAVPPAPDAPLLRFSGAILLGEVTIYRTHAAAGTGAFSIDGLAGVRNRREQARERRRRRHVSGWHSS
jgi:uncharacterized membrane protein